MSDEAGRLLSGSVSEVSLELSRESHRSVYGYVRVSSRSQDLEGESLQTQAEAIRVYCRENGLDEPLIVSEVASARHPMFALPSIAGVHADNDTSARPLLLLLLGHISALQNCSLVLFKLDRLSRIASEQEILFQLAERHKNTLHSCLASEDSILQNGPDDPVSKMMRVIFGAFAQYERAMIEIRMAAGMRHKAARGGYTGGGKPFGYRVVDGDLRIDPIEAKVVKYIYFLKYQLGASLRDISHQLEHELKMKFPHTKVNRVLKSESLYRGYYRDRYKEIHLRDDLIILDKDGYDYATLFGEGTHHANTTID